MKKILFSIIALIGLFSSCSNDEITIERTVTFKVNPATVVDNLYEYKAGDLTALSNSSKLNVILLIYNENGLLVDEVSNEYSAYTHIMNADINLSPGKYTAVAISHVTSSIDYWEFSGLEKLSTFKIKDLGKIGGKNKILGLTIKDIVIGENSETINIEIENAGAVAHVYFYHWNKYNDVKEYAFMGKQACDYVSFDNNGNKDYSLRSESSYKFYKVMFIYDDNYDNACDYFFTFPIKNASFRFYAVTTDKQYVPLGTECVDDVNIGESYRFIYDFDKDKTYWYDKTPNKAKSSINVEFIEKIQCNSRIKYDNEANSISIR